MTQDKIISSVLLENKTEAGSCKSTLALFLIMQLGHRISGKTLTNLSILSGYNLCRWQTLSGAFAKSHNIQSEVLVRLNAGTSIVEKSIVDDLVASGHRQIHAGLRIELKISSKCSWAKHVFSPIFLLCV